MSTNDREIAVEASNFIKELEVERVMKSFKLNPFDVLDLPFNATENDVKKQYRKKSLLIHPDKFKHERGVEAFDWLKKAEQSLSNKEPREDIDRIVLYARRGLLAQFEPPLPPTTTDDDPMLPTDWRSQILQEVRMILIDEEVARRRAIKNTLANEGLEAQKKEEEIAKRKRKIEDDKAWEDNRDARVNDWRKFSKKPSKKKSKNGLDVLG
ncbi:Predicted molecular chaperone (DnaJ superfamily) [Phaffia rhodozyma]|uniref:Predicted molecular chaperone (DnaJ superfamily) n=1 Tax=Phaffia rhodozyma TaxID=264483 RepID=A0A0F7SGV0_PHARH|nr:Predicted molecular chaperone (DnaJ superfamily) [Phaffia rhodozyma]